MIFEEQFEVCCQSKGCLEALDASFYRKLPTSKNAQSVTKDQGATMKKNVNAMSILTWAMGKPSVMTKIKQTKKHQWAAWISLCAVGQVKEEIQAAGLHVNSRTKQTVNEAQVEQE